MVKIESDRTRDGPQRRSGHNGDSNLSLTAYSPSLFPLPVQATLRRKNPTFEPPTALLVPYVEERI
jgi:hypothetical protein